MNPLTSTWSPLRILSYPIQLWTEMQKQKRMSHQILMELPGLAKETVGSSGPSATSLQPDCQEQTFYS